MIFKVMLRVISMVPSLTETLLEAGVEVVGRTRFCIHPQQKVLMIPAVGGTKNVDWRQTNSLQADLVIFDKEENTKEMAESCPWPYLATHIRGIADVAPELEKIAAHLANENLMKVARRWRRLQPEPPLSWQDLPVMEWLEKPRQPIRRMIYLIWKKPWMAAASQTFIGSVFAHLGFAGVFFQHEKKYPEIDLEKLAGPDTLLLFSSEPYPFAKRKTDLMSIPGPKAIVDGEGYSWFGIRSLKFLENLAALNQP